LLDRNISIANDTIEKMPAFRVSLPKITGALGLIAILAFLLLPTVIIIPMSFGTASYLEFPPRGLTLAWYRDYFADADWMAATWFSLRIAITTTIAATVIGTAAAIALVRGSFLGKEMIQAVIMAPLIVPHIVIAVALYLFFAPIGLTGNFYGFVIANTMLSVPYVVITITAALQRFNVDLELAALNCGANRIQAFFHVVLPNILPGVMGGAVFAFLASFDEATVAFFISGLEGKTITRKMFEDIDFNLTPVIAAVSSVLMIVSVILMSAIELARRNSTR
jgi:mannopine transport system permease protein